MTCIAVVRHEGKVFLSGERGSSDSETILILSNPKVWKIGPYLMGYAGGLNGERIRYNFNPYIPDIKDTDKFMQTKFIKQLKTFYDDWWIDTSKDADLEMIVCIRGEIYTHAAVDMSLIRYTGDYLAIGSGEQFALGYLNATEKSKDPKSRAIGAINSAIKFSPSCVGPVDTVSI